MLFWEALTLPRERNGGSTTAQTVILCPQRLPFDKRCVVVTKSGKRCKGRIRPGADHCPLHDPALAAERRLRPAPKGVRAHRRLSHLPDGYLRKLTNRAAVGNAMDRLYRELRLGIVTNEMASVLFNVLTRLLDSGLVDSGKLTATARNRSKASRLRPKLSELLTRPERAAWQRAVANAPASVLQTHDGQRPALQTGAKINGANRQEVLDRPVKLALQAAS
jgi:hypothetical protein